MTDVFIAHRRRHSGKGGGAEENYLSHSLFFSCDNLGTTAASALLPLWGCYFVFFFGFKDQQAEVTSLFLVSTKTQLGRWSMQKPREKALDWSLARWTPKIQTLEITANDFIIVIIINNKNNNMFCHLI